MFDVFGQKDFLQRHGTVLRKFSSTRPMLWVVEENGVRAVVKDFRSNGFLFRNIAGRFLIWREGKALRRLSGIKGVPSLYRIIDGVVLVMEEVPGRNLEEIQGQRKLPGEFFEEMKDLVDRFHQRGVAHCDLKRAPNTLVDPDGRPYIVDWAASIFMSEFRFFPFNHIFRRFLHDDYMAIVKLKLRHCPEAVSREESVRYAYKSRLEVLIRKIRDRLREWLQRVA